MNATYYETLTAVQTAVQGLNFTLNGPVPVVIRKLPVRQESIDPSTQIIVCPGDEGEEYKGLAFGGHYTFSPLTQVVVISPNNAEEYVPLDTYLQWRESIATALGQLNIGLARKLVYDPPIDRASVSDNYDYLSIGVRYELWV